MLDEDVGIALLASGIDLPSASVHKLALHLSMVLEANATMNLTSVTDPRVAIWAHIVDSLLGLPEADEAPEGAMADLGSGAGYPGIPLAIATGRRVTLVESVKKKAAFLSTVLRRLDLHGDVKPERAEELAIREPRCYALATARAVASLPSLVELAAPLLCECGSFVAYKGRRLEDEIARGDSVAARVGLKRSSVREARLLGPEPSARTLISYSIARSASIKLPRRPGMAQRHPLA